MLKYIFKLLVKFLFATIEVIVEKNGLLIKPLALNYEEAEIQSLKHHKTFFSLSNF